MNGARQDAPPFRSLLIANRGEVAVRILRACRELGIEPVAICSKADRGALWTRLADRVVEVGAAPARQSYLSIERLLAAAREAGVEAIHPGYGLLSESAAFAEATLAAGMAFVGPDPATIARMGDKVAAREAAFAAGVPVLPGSDGAIRSPEAALESARAIGFPVVVKASFGGGGRGLRVAADAAALGAAIEQAGREAAAAFGRDELFLERYLDRPRHVEVQILADRHGHVVHLGDRDCSVQRRHQKLLEEAPAPALRDTLRQAMHEAAVRLCQQVGYTGAGTVEFLVDPERHEFFFLEMNPRLQVEHGLSELLTGIDIVKAQIEVAAGRPLGFGQQDIAMRGHAIEARIAAEDPFEDFRPSPGRISALRLPAGPFVRLDFGVEAGDQVPPYYDSLFGKIEVLGRDRTEARQRLAAALDSLLVAGVPTTAPYLRSILEQPDYVRAAHDTGSVERDWLPDPAARPAPATATPAPPDDGRPTAMLRHVRLPWGGRMVEVAVPGLCSDGGRSTAAPRPGRGAPTSGESGDVDAGRPAVTAPMDGMVLALSCRSGQRVGKGDALVVVEAMKMEMVVRAPMDGVVRTLRAEVGQPVRAGATLAEIDPE